MKTLLLIIGFILAFIGAVYSASTMLTTKQLKPHQETKEECAKTDCCYRCLTLPSEVDIK